MSRVENILRSLALVGNRVQSVIPEEHRCYRHFDFSRVMLNSANRVIDSGEEIPAEVLFYLERLVGDINLAIDSYERYEIIDSVSREEWSVFEYLMSFFSSCSISYNNSTDLDQMASDPDYLRNEILGRDYSDDNSKI